MPRDPRMSLTLSLSRCAISRSRRSVRRFAPPAASWGVPLDRRWSAAWTRTVKVGLSEPETEGIHGDVRCTAMPEERPHRWGCDVVDARTDLAHKSSRPDGMGIALRQRGWLR